MTMEILEYQRMEIQMATETRTRYDGVYEVLKRERTAIRMAFMGEFTPEYYTFENLEIDIIGDYITRQIEINLRRAVQEYSEIRGLRQGPP